MAEVNDGVACTHACAYGCGRTYDIIIVQVIDNSTMMLCMPCGVSFFANVAKAMIEPDDSQVQEVVAGTDLSDVMVVTDDKPGYAIRGHSDPVQDDEFEFDGMG